MSQLKNAWLKAKPYLSADTAVGTAFLGGFALSLTAANPLLAGVGGVLLGGSIPFGMGRDRKVSKTFNRVMSGIFAVFGGFAMYYNTDLKIAERQQAAAINSLPTLPISQQDARKDFCQQRDLGVYRFSLNGQDFKVQCPAP